MAESNGNNWRVNKKVDLSVIVQLVLLASLILGSWINLQRQLDLLHRDVTTLVHSNEKFCEKVERLSEKMIGHEYRIKTVETSLSKAD